MKFLFPDGIIICYSHNQIIKLVKFSRCGCVCVGGAVASADFPAVYSPVLNLICYYNKWWNISIVPMSSSLFTSFQENTKCESSFFADTCTRRVPIFIIAIRKTSIRCTMTPRIQSKNTTLANNCRVHIVYIQRVKVMSYVIRQLISHFDSSISTRIVIKFYIIDDRFHVWVHCMFEFRRQSARLTHCRYIIASWKTACYITHIVWVSLINHVLSVYTV
jgi:hypothetical protein